MGRRGELGRRKGPAKKDPGRSLIGLSRKEHPKEGALEGAWE